MTAENIKAMAIEFAKKNKVSAAKVEQFALELLSTTKKGGKKPSEKSVEIREKLAKSIKDGDISGEVTSKQVAAYLGSDIQTVNNAIRYVADNHGLIKRSGVADKKPGEKGRREVLWSVSPKA